MSSEIKQFFEIFESLVADEHQANKAFNQTSSHDKTYIIVRWLGFIVITCAVLSFLVFTFTQILFLLIWLDGNLVINLYSWISKYQLFSLIGVSKLLYSILFAITFLGFILLLILAGNSNSSGLAHMKCISEVDEKYLTDLVLLSEKTLKLGCIELKHGRDGFTRWISNLVGVVEKVGIIPSILSLVAIYVIPEKLPEWASLMMMLCVICYGLALVMQERLLRFDRMIDLTKLALKLKNKLYSSIE